MSSSARFCIGFACGYWLLVWLPWCLGTVGGVSLGWWFDVGQWTIEHILRLPSHAGESSQSGNVLTPYVSTAAFAAVSAVIAAFWLALDPRGVTHRVAFVWVFAAVRFTLAAFMLAYGWVKVLPAQFGLMASGAGTDYLMQQVGQLPPRDLLWAFMEASRAYQLSSGLVELVGGLLLLTRRTTMWGVFVSGAAMANVLMLNIAYDVVVKFLAGQVLLAAAFVAAPYLKGLGATLARHAEERSPGAVFQTASGRWTRVAQIAGVIVGCLLVAWTYRTASRISVHFAQAPTHTPLHGIWDVEAVSRDGVDQPLLITERSLWRRLVLPWGGTDAGAMLVWMSDAVTRGRSRIDTRARTLTIEPAAESTVPGSVRPPPQAPPRMFFTYTIEPGGGLLLKSADQSGPLVLIRLKRFDHSKYPLLAHQRGWRW
jgi:hypothetical protein